GEVDLACSRIEDLRERLDDAVLDESFLHGDIADLIADLHRMLGLRPPTRAAAPPDDQDPDDEDEPEPPAAAPAEATPHDPEPWRVGGRLAPPIDPPSWETG
ncbi:MAG TPA: hypothetical protein VFH92_05575, partial [Phenylobacterium sp.]|nr:hypothetical protein [Phenylobacterium sp.]